MHGTTQGGISQKTDLVVERFATNTAGLDKLQIAEIYEKEYAAAVKTESFKIPDVTWWIVTGCLAVLVILGNTLKSWIGTGFAKLGKALYDRLAGTRLLRRFALSKYERALLAKHENVFVPFRQNRPPLKMSTVFVP